MDLDLIRKLCDSFLYEWAADRLAKPVQFLVLVAAETLSSVLLHRRSQAFARTLPVEGPADGQWKRQIAASCLVLNVRSWNDNFPEMPVRRVYL